MNKNDKILRVCLAFLAVILVAALVRAKIEERIENEKKDEVISKYAQAVSENDYIMHALGGIDGHTYTNSKEALEHSRKNGAKFYEVDVRLTEDGKLVLVGGWLNDDSINGSGTDYYFQNETIPYDQYMKTKIQNHFTPIDFDYFVKFMKENPDVYVMLDFGRQDTSYLRKACREILSITNDESVLDRMIIGAQAIEVIGAVRGVYDFKLYVLSWPPEWGRTDERIDTKEEFLAYCKKNKISSLSTSVETYENEREAMQFFKDNGLIIYVFTEDDEERAKSLLEGADMVGTNFLVP